MVMQIVEREALASLAYPSPVASFSKHLGARGVNSLPDRGRCNRSMMLVACYLVRSVLSTRSETHNLLLMYVTGK